MVKKSIENYQRLQQKLGYTFSDEGLLQQALTHRSAGYINNERLEYLGDAILNFVIADRLYQQFPNAKEGELTRARASLVKKETLAALAGEFVLGDYLNLGIGEQRSGGGHRESILADAFEAIIGAIYRDSDFSTVQDCLVRWYVERLSQVKFGEEEKDPKTRLQEILQAKQKPLPLYEVVSIVGEPHAQHFTVSCEIEGVNPTLGEGGSRRLAEQKAAFIMLEKISNDT